MSGIQFNGFTLAIDQIKSLALWSKLWSKPNEVIPQTKNPTISNVKSLDLWSEWRESNSRPLEPHCAPLADTLVKTAHNIRYITNFRIHFFILFRLMSRSFVSIVVKLWSTDPDKRPFSPRLSYIAQFRFSKIEVALFYLHELSIRRNFQ